MEILLGIPPMNQLDATAAPIDIFRDEADLRPFQAVLPDVALNNLINQPARDAKTAYWMKRTAEQNLTHADLASPRARERYTVPGKARPDWAMAGRPARRVGSRPLQPQGPRAC